jgi:hypothetical protein
MRDDAVARRNSRDHANSTAVKKSLQINRLLTNSPVTQEQQSCWKTRLENSPVSLCDFMLLQKGRAPLPVTNVRDDKILTSAGGIRERGSGHR